MNPDLLAAINRSCEAKVSFGIPSQEIVPTGLPALDTAIGGGIPRGRIVEIYGREASGKTALALYLAKQLPGPTLYVDADHGLSPYILQGQDLYLLSAGTLEDTLDACFTAACSGAFGAIVIDTVAALPTDADMRVSINDPCGGAAEKQAKVMSKALPILAPVLHRSGCTLILVNQMRDKRGIMYGDPEHPTGGKAIPYYAALRLKTHRYETVMSAKIVTGQKILVKVEKCKYGPPGKRAVAQLVYGEGLCA